MPQKIENSPCKCELDCVSICSVRKSSLAVCNKEALTIANILYLYTNDEAHTSGSAWARWTSALRKGTSFRKNSNVSWCVCCVHSTKFSFKDMNRSPNAEGIEIGRADKPRAPKSRLDFLALEEDTKKKFSDFCSEAAWYWTFVRQAFFFFFLFFFVFFLSSSRLLLIFVFYRQENQTTQRW